MFSSPNNKPIIIIPETPIVETKKIAKPNRVPLFAEYEQSLISASKLFEDVYGDSDVPKRDADILNTSSKKNTTVHDGEDENIFLLTDYNFKCKDTQQGSSSDVIFVDDQIAQIDSDKEVPKKRRKLVRKDQLKSQESQGISSSVKSTPEEKDDIEIIEEISKVSVVQDSDEDQINEHIGSIITKLLNTESLANIQESLLCSESQAQYIINHRPQNSYLDWLEVTDKGVKKLITKHYTKLIEFQSVEDIFIHCDDVSQEISGILESWNAKTSASKYPCLQAQPDFVTKEFSLFSYQLIGVSWLYLLYTKGLGGILADEMGLGKSCQIVTFLGLLKSKGEGGLNLIIVPATVLDNWVRELNMWVPTLNVIAYTGDQNERRDWQLYIMENQDLDVIVTTYNQASGTMDRRFLRSLKCKTLILDEGHMIKNSSSQRAVHLKNLNIPFRLLLTGTPLQNNLKELLALLTFIMPELFGPCFDQLSIIFDDQKSKSYRDVISKLQIERAKKMMSPFILQRLKQDVQSSLPPKIHKTEYCIRNSVQTEMYEVNFLLTIESIAIFQGFLSEIVKRADGIAQVIKPSAAA
ncbi:hypothetical protein HDV01_006150 [Terramyces sp. JEL0728]|nr:hypothetical protein HDV01_006150 [Terramyces sp. JEL0728]